MKKGRGTVKEGRGTMKKGRGTVKKGRGTGKGSTFQWSHWGGKQTVNTVSCPPDVCKLSVI